MFLFLVLPNGLLDRERGGNIDATPCPIFFNAPLNPWKTWCNKNNPKIAQHLYHLIEVIQPEIFYNGVHQDTNPQKLMVLPHRRMENLPSAAFVFV